MKVEFNQPARIGLSASASVPVFGNTSFSSSFGGTKGFTTQLGQDGKRISSGYNGNPSHASASIGLYATPSYDSIHTEPEDLEPGPGSYDVPRGFGYQQLSQHYSQPCSSLTAKHDKAWSKVMITKDHLSAIMARGTPGPGTYQPAMLSSRARVRFGTSKRRGLSDTAFRAPGPVYESKEELDPMAQVKFGKANRFDSDNQGLSKLLGSTGPGQYEVGSSFDGNRLSKSFGASHRAYDKVRFPGSDRVEVGKASPGPGALQPFQNSGKTNAFGRAERLPADTLAAKRAPGPGAYDVHDKPCPHSRSRSVFSFGRPPAKARVNWKQMQHLTHSLWGVR